MAIHYKTDLYNDAQRAAASATEVGDILELDVPAPDGSFTHGGHRVLAIETSDAGEHDGVHYTRINLKLEGPL
jgi:hypothetical protein